MKMLNEVTGANAGEQVSVLVSRVARIAQFFS
jgi:hypothetical protein